MRVDERADRSARLLGAEAVTIGEEVLFRSDRYAPDTDAGRTLIAHELSHVEYQGRVGSVFPQRSVAGNILSVQFTEEMAKAMTDEELGQQMQILRAHLQVHPDDRGPAENLAVLEQVAYGRQGTGAPAPPVASPGPSPITVPAAPKAISNAPAAGPDAPVPSPLKLPDEGVEMPWVGKGGTNSSELGYLRDPVYFWQRFQSLYPQEVSPANRALIASGASPIVDQTWLSFHPEHGAYAGQTLEHHHVGQGSWAVPIPEDLHDAYTVFHPQRRVVGTPAGGTRPLPPRPTGAEHQAEIDRHVQQGRIRGPGITTENPPVAPTIPPGSELAGVPADKLGPVTPDAVPAPAPGSAGGGTSTVPAAEGETPHVAGPTGMPSVGGLVSVAAANALAGWPSPGCSTRCSRKTGPPPW